ncbi:MAG: hypothetical protein ABI855_16675, partial [Bacteroidota bacterium]
MTRNLLLILIALVLYSNLKAQPTQFFKNYDINTKSDFAQTSDMILTFDSSYVIACISFDSIQMLN